MDAPQRHRGHRGKSREDDAELSGLVIAAAIEVHRHLGPGLLESAYEAALCHELRQRSIPFDRQQSLPVSYKGLELDCAYRLDLLVDKRLIVEIKSVERLLPIHQAQLLTYLRLAHVRLGLLINFQVPVLRNGIKRLVLD